MKNIFDVQILRSTALDLSIKVKVIAVLLIFETLIPTQISIWMILALFLLLSYRFIFWKPHLAFRRMDIAIMYMGYLAIVLQLLIKLLSRTTSISLIGTVAIHVFTFGAMGLVIPAHYTTWIYLPRFVGS
jgi:uncharacterized protein involved in response to NO